MDLYEFVQDCMERGLSSEEALNEWNEAVEEQHQRFLDDYYSDPLVNEGWHQQDVIDMYRRER